MNRYVIIPFFIIILVFNILALRVTGQNYGPHEFKWFDSKSISTLKTKAGIKSAMFRNCQTIILPKLFPYIIFLLWLYKCGGTCIIRKDAISISESFSFLDSGRKKNLNQITRSTQAGRLKRFLRPYVRLHVGLEHLLLWLSVKVIYLDQSFTCTY